MSLRISGSNEAIQVDSTTCSVSNSTESSGNESSTCSKTSCTSKSGKSEGNLKTKGTNMKNKIQSQPLRTRIVPSRYKQAAADVLQKSNSPSDASKSGSSLENTRRSYLGTLGSTRNISRIGMSSVKPSCISKSKDMKTKLRMHSTAVNSSTFLEKTQIESTDSFSNTIVGGQVPFKFGPRSSVSVSDISGIGPLCGRNIIASPSPGIIEENCIEEAIGSLSISSENVLESEEKVREYTNEEINAEYLQYLTWAFIDVRSKEAFQKQVKEAENEINFLAQLVVEETKKVFEESQKLALLKKYEELCTNYDSLKNELITLKESSYPSATSLKELTDNLESQINQIKWENIHIPDDKEKFTDQFNDALEESIMKLDNINFNIKSNKELVESDVELFDSLKQDLTEMITCLEKAQNLSKLSIQEASLKLSNM